MRKKFFFRFYTIEKQATSNLKPKYKPKIVVNGVLLRILRHPDSAVARQQVMPAVAQIELEVHHEEQGEDDGESGQADEELLLDPDHPRGELHRVVEDDDEPGGLGQQSPGPLIFVSRGSSGRSFYVRR